MTWCWLLNPDAELELAHHASKNPGPYTPSARTREAMKARTELFLELSGADAVTQLDELANLSIPNGTRLLPWCPTPSIVAACRRAGRRLPPIPETNSLIHANDKSRLSDWQLPLIPGRILARKAAQLHAHLAQSSTLRLKRRFGFAGRGQRRVTGTWSEDDARWIRDSFAQGALIAEPELPQPELVSVHLMIHPEETLVGTPLGFVCDEFGSFFRWEESFLKRATALEIQTHAKRAAACLLEIGYFGPASIDFVVLPGRTPYAIDLNARFSLGWTRGMGPLRQRALELYWIHPSD